MMYDLDPITLIGALSWAGMLVALLRAEPGTWARANEAAQRKFPEALRAAVFAGRHRLHRAHALLERSVPPIERALREKCGEWFWIEVSSASTRLQDFRRREAELRRAETVFDACIAGKPAMLRIVTRPAAIRVVDPVAIVGIVRRLVAQAKQIPSFTTALTRLQRTTRGVRRPRAA